MNSENIQHIDNAVKGCLGVIDHETKNPADAYHAAITLLKKVLIKHELYIGPKEMRILAESSSSRGGQYSPEGVTDAVRIIEALLNTSKVNNLEFAMEVLVNNLTLTLGAHRAKLSPKHCDMLEVMPTSGTIDPREYVDTLIAYYENNPDIKMSADDYDRLSQFVNHSNERTVGTIIDHSNTTERYRINMPVMSDDLSNALMDLAERMGNGGYRVDKRAWDHLLIYSPQFQKLKKKLKRLKRILKLI